MLCCLVFGELPPSDKEMADPSRRPLVRWGREIAAPLAVVSVRSLRRWVREIAARPSPW